jgi:hypothetical protein
MCCTDVGGMLYLRRYVSGAGMQKKTLVDLITSAAGAECSGGKFSSFKMEKEKAELDDN